MTAITPQAGIGLPDLIERRTITIDAVEWRDSSASGELKMIVSGNAAVFNSNSLELRTRFGAFSERIDPSAFDEVLATNPDVHLTWDHDMKTPLARTLSPKYGLELRATADGLHFYANTAPTSYAKDLRLLMESGVIDQASFGFTTPEDGSGETWEIDNEGGVLRTVRNVSFLSDICICAQGAYSDASSMVLRSLEKAGHIPEEFLTMLTSVAPDEPAGTQERTIAPDPVGGEPSQDLLGVSERNRNLEALLEQTAAAVEVEQDRLREASRRKYRLHQE